MLTPSLSVEHCRRRLILRFYGIFVCSRFYITDGKSEKLCKKLDAVVSGHVVSFCNGLALLSTHYLTNQHLVFNPVSNKITTTISPLSSEDSLCALFFHPVAKEYRILNVLKRRADHYVYYLYLFGSKTWRRTAKPSFHSRPPNIKKYYYHTKMFNKNPAIANGAVHWYVRGGQILTFDMIGFYGEKGYCLPDVLVNEEEDRLCCCYMGSPEPVMDVWVMEDYAKWAWIRKYVVNMDWDAIEYPLIGGLRVGAHLLVDVLVVSIHKDELVLFWHNRGMFSYRLGDNTIEKIKLREMDEYEYTPPSFGYMGCCTANH
ncbi:hypothetical protein PHJA_002025100 [Phtheirospermum japonicum]|uniref:F-box associated beta-propeller type 1 domain-containing protein n=1 Tax=Phtheirospermum japonicum TaxID=374723 RepID=A0A830CKP7_9LAMI|nr:hypothetical protein PHJA_002025100 [Phtheirospermum japonicum]